jgi:hypothetical protein
MQGSSSAFEAWRAMGPMVVRNSLTILSFDLTGSSAMRVGTPATFVTSLAGADTAMEYKFYVYRVESRSWTVIQDYSRDASVVWVPSQAGTYNAQLWVRRAGSTEASEVFASAGPYVVQP